MTPSLTKVDEELVRIAQLIVGSIVPFYSWIPGTCIPENEREQWEREEKERKEKEAAQSQTKELEKVKKQVKSSNLTGRVTARSGRITARSGRSSTMSMRSDGSMSRRSEDGLMSHRGGTTHRSLEDSPSQSVLGESTVAPTGPVMNRNTYPPFPAIAPKSIFKFHVQLQQRERDKSKKLSPEFRKWQMSMAAKPEYINLIEQQIGEINALNADFRASANRYIASWEQHEFLWKRNKEQVMEQFVAKEPALSDFDAELANYYRFIVDNVTAVNQNGDQDEVKALLSSSFEELSSKDDSSSAIGHQLSEFRQKIEGSRHSQGTEISLPPVDDAKDYAVVNFVEVHPRSLANSVVQHAYKWMVAHLCVVMNLWRPKLRKLSNQFDDLRSRLVQTPETLEELQDVLSAISFIRKNHMLIELDCDAVVEGYRLLRIYGYERRARKSLDDLKKDVLTEHGTAAERRAALTPGALGSSAGDCASKAIYVRPKILMKHGIISAGIGSGDAKRVRVDDKACEFIHVTVPEMTHGLSIGEQWLDLRHLAEKVDIDIVPTKMGFCKQTQKNSLDFLAVCISTARQLIHTGPAAVIADKVDVRKKDAVSSQIKGFRDRTKEKKKELGVDADEHYDESDDIVDAPKGVAGIIDGDSIVKAETREEEDQRLLIEQ
ncbi:Dynein-1-alpha heavy chain, flagellar inner arm I1 complex, partial [Aduncisulcus paluster]